MNRFSRVSLSLLLFFLLSPLLFAQQRTPVHITVLHLNDMHGRLLPYIEKSISEDTSLGGVAYLAMAVQEERAENSEGTLLLSAGDMFQGTPLSNVFQGRPVIEAMNRLQFDAMSLGNHEFDWGQDALQSLRASASFPFLSANIKDSEGEYLPGIKPYVILDRKGMRIAIIGITTPETAYTTKPSNVSDLTFSHPAIVLPGLIKKVREENASLVIVLSHLGLDADKELAGQVPGIDVIVGGHSHTVLSDPVEEHGTLIVQAGYNGLYLGVLDLLIDPSTNKITEYTRRNELKPISAKADAPFDPEIARIVGIYNDQIKEEFAKVVGETSVELVRHPEEESNIGNLITDAMRQVSGTDIALQNGGGIRADLPKGKITLESVYTLLPFDNALVVMDLSGSQILEVLEENAAMEHKMLQVSGLKVEYDIEKPLGSRVVKAVAGDEPLDTARLYRVAVNDFMAAGGDGLVTLKEGKNVEFGDDLREAFTAYLQKHSPVSPRVEGRISFSK